MYQAWHIIFALTPHRNHIAALADGDDGVPQKFRIGRRGNDFLQAFFDFTALNPHMSANIRQSGAGGIGNLFLGQNRTKNTILQIFVGGQTGKQLLQNSRLLVFRNVAFYNSGAPKHSGNGQQFLGVEASSPFRPFQRRGNITDLRKPGVPLLSTHPGSCGGFLQALAHFVQVRNRTQVQTRLFSSFTSGAIGKPDQNLIQLQLRQRFFIQRRHVILLSIIPARIYKNPG